MGSHYHSDLEELKRKAELAKFAKKVTDLESDDVLVVMHKVECDLMLDLAYKILESNEPMEKKKIALNLIKHLEA